MATKEPRTAKTAVRATLLRKLIRKRSQGRRRWRGFIRIRDSVTKTFEKAEPIDRFVEYWDTLSPEEQAAAWDEFRKLTGQG